MAWTTEAGKSERGSSLYLRIPEGKTRAEFVVQVMAEAPENYSPNKPAERKITGVFEGTDGTEWGNVVFGCSDGVIDVSRPSVDVGGWKNVHTFWNMLAEATGICPDATENGIRKANGDPYGSFGAFIRDLTMRGKGWVKISLYLKDGKYTEFSDIIGAANDGKPYQAAKKSGGAGTEPEF